MKIWQKVMMLLFVSLVMCLFLGEIARAEECITKESSIFYPGNSYDKHPREFYKKLCSESRFYGKDWADAGAYWECLDNVDVEHPEPTITEKEIAEIINCGKVEAGVTVFNVPEQGETFIDITAFSGNSTFFSSLPPVVLIWELAEGGFQSGKYGEKKLMYFDDSIDALEWLNEKHFVEEIWDFKGMRELKYHEIKFDEKKYGWNDRSD